MTKTTQFLFLMYKRFCAYFPSSLPTGKTKYETWLKSIIELAGPLADEQSMAWALSNEILHLPPKKDKVRKITLVRALRKAAANQVASYKVMELKTQQEERNKQQTAAEDTTAKAVENVPG
jgi:hypothetical protein